MGRIIDIIFVSVLVIGIPIVAIDFAQTTAWTVERAISAFVLVGASIILSIIISREKNGSKS